MIKLVEIRNKAAKYFTRPAAELLSKTSITPNFITWLGFALTLCATTLIITGHPFAAGFVVLIAGYFDMIDGALARLTNKVTRFGAILDSTLDRFSEAALLLGIMYIYVQREFIGGVMLVSLTLLGSLMVSYIRARVETLGFECKVGVFTRTERVIILALGLLLSQFDYALITALVIITLFSFITIAQRLLFAWRRTRD